MLNIFGLLVMSGKDEDMMAMLWAQQIMLGKKTYAQVPRLLFSFSVLHFAFHFSVPGFHTSSKLAIDS